MCLAGMRDRNSFFLLAVSGKPVQPVGIQCFQAAKVQPVMIQGRIVEEVEHDRLVIARKADAADADEGPGRQPGEHCGRFRSTINVVAEHDQPFRAVALAAVRNDQVFQPAQRVIVAMYITDGIDMVRSPVEKELPPLSRQ